MMHKFVFTAMAGSPFPRRPIPIACKAVDFVDIPVPEHVDQIVEAFAPMAHGFRILSPGTYGGYIGTMEKKMETTMVQWGIYRNYYSIIGYI